jgi:hypothetical protein
MSLRRKVSGTYLMELVLGRFDGVFEVTTIRQLALAYVPYDFCADMTILGTRANGLDELLNDLLGCR